ncbi:MAG: deoxyguanosinetriphosphate triphosphohydrolase [Eubacteriales bacterium]|nr:deoxyguanosinetriphosphate triphosphohydrolase [Eubacteriales bacterium]
MTIREMTEEREKAYLSEYACLSTATRGREVPEAECDIRPVFQRDRDRILHSKSFRRLEHKTQVFLSPQGDHYRNRLTHTLEVSQVARTITQALRLNESLAEAIAMGHDLGHTPFGHAGERVLNQLHPEGFVHSEQSVRVVELLEKKGKGLNLTWEVRDGILNHRTAGHPSTLEGRVVQLSDKIAYINHDIDDAERAGILPQGIPREYTDVLGTTIRERLNTMIHDIVTHSKDQPRICMSEEIEAAMQGIRRFMFENIYTHSAAKAEEGKAEHVIAELYNFYLNHPEKMPLEYLELTEQRNEPLSRAVCDFISGMTDQYAMARYYEIFVPKFWQQ